MRSRVLITGAAGGLGKAFSVDCARRGWDLFLTDIDGERLRRLGEAIARTYGVQVGWAPADLTDPGSCETLFEQILAAPYRFRVLINVAGLDHEGIFLDRSRDEMRTIVDLNIEGTLAVTHALLPRRDPGATFRIITVASLAAFFPMPVKATYAASKRFLVYFSLALREELKGLGATVTILCPAGLPTAASTIEAIEAQGFIGHITTKNIGYVASSTIDRALQGKSIYVPGTLNQTLRFLGRMLPARWISAFVGKRWRDAHARRFGVVDTISQSLVSDSSFKTEVSPVLTERAAA
jgi:short-subunit dehydrogenase